MTTDTPDGRAPSPSEALAMAERVKFLADGYAGAGHTRLLPVQESARATVFAAIDRLAALATIPKPPVDTFRIALHEWAVAGWRSEVQNRPLVNIHRKRLGDFWRAAIRKAGGDPTALVGPSHDELVGASATPTPEAATPTRKPLTEAEIASLNREAQDQGVSGIAPSIYLARAIERAHGITGDANV